MNAIQPSRPPSQPREPRPSNTRQKKAQRRLNRHPHRARALENTVKLVANTVLCSAAIYGLANLLPNVWAGQQKWQEISTEVKQAQGRVNSLRQDFSRYFDPRQAKTVMQEQSNLVEPGQRQVFLLDQSKK